MQGTAVMRSPWLRTGRAIAMIRVLLAATFLISLWIDPTQPTRQVDTADFAVSAYLACSVAMLMIAWTSWRLEWILALPALLLDIAAFLAGLYFTESESSSFTSPYVAGFVFIVSSTLLRWGQRRALLMALGLAALFLLDSQVLEALGINVDLPRMLRVLVYMCLIALAFIWISPTAGAIRVPNFSPPAGARTPQTLLRAALDYAIAVTGARGGVVAWGEKEGPPHELIERRDGARTAVELGPEAVELLAWPSSPSSAVLISPQSKYTLSLSSSGTRVLSRNVQSGLLIDCARGEDAIVLPVEAAGLEARLALWGIAGICGDDLQLVACLRRDIENALDRSHILVLQEREMTTSLRSALARDLHDGVAQSLAGALLRLQGLRIALRNGRDPSSNLDDAMASLRSEQANVREMIHKLKDGVSLPTRTDLDEQLRGWLGTAGKVWGVAVAYTLLHRSIQVSALVAFEIRQLLREAIANSARHGKCRQVHISINRGPHDSLYLTIDDDGNGLAAGRMPHSIAERVAALGGELETGKSALGGARLTLSLPKVVKA